MRPSPNSAAGSAAGSRNQRVEQALALVEVAGFEQRFRELHARRQIVRRRDQRLRGGARRPRHDARGAAARPHPGTASRTRAARAPARAHTPDARRPIAPRRGACGRARRPCRRSWIARSRPDARARSPHAPQRGRCRARGEEGGRVAARARGSGLCADTDSDADCGLRTIARCGRKWPHPQSASAIRSRQKLNRMPSRI